MSCRCKAHLLVHDRGKWIGPVSLLDQCLPELRDQAPLHHGQGAPPKARGVNATARVFLRDQDPEWTSCGWRQRRMSGIGKWTPDIWSKPCGPRSTTLRSNCRFGIMDTKDQHHRPCHSSLAMHRARMPNMRKLTTPSTSRPRSRRLLLHCWFRNHSAFPGSLWKA